MGGALERAAARVCREAGARVTTHTLLSDLNVPSVDRFDNRRIEVITNGLPLHHGAQFAVDTTLVFPPHQRWATPTAAWRLHRCREAGPKSVHTQNSSGVGAANLSWWH